jgi:hypothetical protein
MTNDVDAISEIGRKLDILIRLVAMQVGSELSVAVRAPLLSRAGLDRSLIASVCNTTPGAVSVRLAEAKRRPRSKSKARR